MAERALAAVPFAIMRADVLFQPASLFISGKQSWTMVAEAAAYMFQLKGNSSLCIGVKGGTNVLTRITPWTSEPAEFLA